MIRRESQYIDSYLNLNGKYTVNTYLQHVLKGSSKRYFYKYRDALMNAINRRLYFGEIEKSSSVLNGVSYKRKDHMENVSDS